MELSGDDSNDRHDRHRRQGEREGRLDGPRRHATSPAKMVGTFAENLAR